MKSQARVVAIILSSAVLMGSAGPVLAASPMPSQSDRVKAFKLPDAAKKAIDHYGDSVESVYTKPALNLRSLSSKNSGTHLSDKAKIAESFAKAGETIIASSVSQKMMKYSAKSNGGISSVVYVTTTLKLREVDGSITKSSWSDYRKLDLAPKSGNYSVVSDTYTKFSGDENAESADFSSSYTGGQSRVSSASRTGRYKKSPSATPKLTAIAKFTKQHEINAKKFARYAKKWTSGKHAGDSKAKMNSKYPYYNNNCANFASQTLDNGGWYLTGGNSFQIKNQTKWTYNLAGVAHASRT